MGDISTLPGSGVQLLRVFSEKMEGQPNISKAFTKFRRISGSSNSEITKDQFLVAMKKWGLNTSGKALNEMWAILDKDHSGSMSFTEFANGVIGNYSVRVSTKGLVPADAFWFRSTFLLLADKQENASLGKVKTKVTTNADGTVHIDHEGVQWILTQLARAVQRKEADVRRTFARFADPKFLVCVTHGRAPLRK